MNQYLQAKIGDFAKTIDFFKKDISQLRTGRANPAILDGVLVEAYSAKTPLQGLASITVPDAKSVLVAPWDKSILKEIEKAITAASLGCGVVNEGDKIRLTMPPTTEEDRKNQVKKLNEKLEEARIAIRQTREQVKTAIEKAEEDKAMSEDDKFRFEKELDEEVAKRNEELKGLRDRKEVEIMTI
jgi:ribosome recycling factor